MQQLSPRQRDVLTALAAVCKRSFDEIKPQNKLAADLGMDSAKGLQFLMELEEKYKVVIPDEDAARMETVRDILKYVEAQS